MALLPLDAVGTAAPARRERTLDATISSRSSDPESSLSIIMNTYGEGALRSSDTRHNTKSNTNARAGTGLDWTRGTDLARGVQKLGAEFLVGGGRGARRAGALVGHLLQPLREAPVDRRLPARVRSRASTRRRRRVDGVEATSEERHETMEDAARRATRRRRARRSRPCRGSPATS